MSELVLVHSSNGHITKTVLVHHGIPGQEWGKRNGPPYPLAYNSHSAAEKNGKYRATYSGDKKKANKPLPKGDDIDHHSDDGSGLNIATSVISNPLGAGIQGIKAAAGAAKSNKYEKERADLEIDKKTGFKKKPQGKRILD